MTDDSVASVVRTGSKSMCGSWNPNPENGLTLSPNLNLDQIRQPGSTRTHLSGIWHLCRDSIRGSLVELDAAANRPALQQGPTEAIIDKGVWGLTVLVFKCQHVYHPAGKLQV